VSQDIRLRFQTKSTIKLTKERMHPPVTPRLAGHGGRVICSLTQPSLNRRSVF
jgi:hypothetical protein